MTQQAQSQWWEVTAKPDCPAIGGRTFRVQAESNLDAKSKVVKQEWGHMFTGLFKYMTAKRVKE
jgi:hypothetical protein